MKKDLAQLSFEESFAKAEFDEKTAHLPARIDEAVPYFLELLRKHHYAIVSGEGTYEQMEKECDELAIKLNGGTQFGMCGEDGAATKLAERAMSPKELMPLWGQLGEWTIVVRGVTVLVEWEGVFGVCSPSFAIHAVDLDKPFFSSTGYRNFFGPHRGAWIDRLTPDQYVRGMLEAHMDSNEGLNGKLEWIAKEHGGPGSPPKEPKKKRGAHR